MRPEEILAWVKAERLSFADFLETLDEHEWDADSLCAGWTVRHVAAHTTMSTRQTLFMTIKGTIRARGDWDRMERELAWERAAMFEPAEIIAQIRETAGSARRAPGAGRLDPLVDFLVHGQDVARPLGRSRQMPVEQAAVALGQVVGSVFYGAGKRLRGTRIIATDCAYAHGDGPHELRGPVGDLLLVATGRPAGLAALEGPGVARVAAAL
ncbi:maleylpyruvate isomerase family mycothiol-dependent enzyme [Phytomonospora sp. NPDC050363]|uniref:maleylpyruvate isomerase family mycothiol-dependent enzyme n=1 Tax=Phytomonospora sp. NPDC050363 TaxID=3155642 RepID=UPI0033D3B764